MRRERRKTSDTYETGGKGGHRDSAANTTRKLSQSLAQTEAGLRTFFQALLRSGMQQALDGYRQLQAVLIQQRLWARTQNRFELDTQFAAIGKVCTQIHAILDGYTQIMARLRDIATYRESDSPSNLSLPPVLSDPEMKVLAKLIMLGAGSLTRFSKETNQESQIVQAAFLHLSKLKLIEARGRGSRKSFRLSPNACAAAVKAIVTNLPLGVGDE